MSQQITLNLLMPVTLFQIEEIRQVEKEKNGNYQIYSWKTSGKYNWLEKGASIVDVLGFIFLPFNRPDTIEMTDDVENNNDFLTK